jgi:hypothetical protein
MARALATEGKVTTTPRRLALPEAGRAGSVLLAEADRYVISDLYAAEGVVPVGENRRDQIAGITAAGRVARAQ